MKRTIDVHFFEWVGECCLTHFFVLLSVSESIIIDVRLGALWHAITRKNQLAVNRTSCHGVRRRAFHGTKGKGGGFLSPPCSLCFKMVGCVSLRRIFTAPVDKAVNSIFATK